jgi:acetolactate synthase I/II/III large subunit
LNYDYINRQYGNNAADALNAAFRTGGVQLIAVPIDYSENTTVLINELRSAALDR